MRASDEEREAIHAGLRDKALASPGELWDSLKGEGLPGEKLEKILADPNASRAGRGLAILRLIEFALNDAATQRADDEIDAAVESLRARRNTGRAALTSQQREDAEDLS